MITFNTATQVAIELESRISKISIANGFNTDIGVKVYRGKRRIDDEAIPCSTITEGNDNPVSRPGRLPLIAIEQDYIVGGYVQCDPDHPNDAAHLVLKDLKTVLFADGGTWGGVTRIVNYKGRDIGPRSDGGNFVFAIVEFSVTYVEDLSKP